MAPGPVERARMEAALRTLESRGPDDSGAWWSEDGTVGLGHTRLAINDEVGGVQPFAGGAGERYVVTVNGEFYGLETKGRSDSHLLPALYERYGLQGMLRRLRGEFAFLLYDRVEKHLLAVRDRFGIKPLFWARCGQELWFASKPSALWAAGVESAWCESNFAHAAATQYPRSGESLFKGVRSIRPSHLLQVKDQECRPQRYWWVKPSQDSQTPQAFAEKLAESVGLRVRSHHPTAVLLSGGVDSASVASLAAAGNTEVKAYTIDFPNPPNPLFSESALARKQAEHSGLEHRVMPLTAADIVGGLGEMVRSTQGLCVNGHGVAKLRLAQAVNEDGIKVLLSGEGADELLFGYRHFSPYFGSSTSTEDPAGLGILVSRESSKLPDGWPHFFRAKYQLGKKIGVFLHSDIQADLAFEENLTDGPYGTDLETARATWLDTALRSYILETLGDGAEMAASVEGRPPFLDHHLWESVGLPSSGDKQLLREAMKGRVVESIRVKSKHPFMAPPLGEPLYAALEEQICEVEHPYVHRAQSLDAIARLRGLSDAQRAEWEPALMWVLSSYHLQELWAS